MPYMIFTVDAPDAANLRATHRQAHFDYLSNFIDKLLASGATYDDEFSRPIGSCILLNVPTFSEAQDFVDGDPFHKAGLAQSISIVPWKPSFIDGKRVP